MPLVGTNFYGTQVQRTPWDDADAQNAAAQDQWRMAQFADARLRQGQSDARAMNQDNLNFGVWREGQQGNRDVRNTAAAERLAAMGFKHAEGMYDKQTGFQTSLFDRGEQAAEARDVRRNKRDDDLYRDRVLPRETRQLAREDAADAEAKRLRDEEAAYRVFMQGTPGTPGREGERERDFVDGTPGIKGFNQRLAGGEFTSEDDLIKAYMGGAGSRGESMLPQVVSGFRQDAQTQADRILADLNSSDPRRRARALEAQKTAPAQVKRLLGATPQTAQDMAAIDPALLPEDTQTQLKRGVGDLAKGINESDNISGAWTGSKSADIQDQIGQIRQKLQAMASANPGVPVSALWKRLRGELDTGGASWNIGRLFGAIDTNTQDANEVAIETLDKEFGAF